MTDTQVGLLAMGLNALAWVLLVWAVVRIRRRLRRRIRRLHGERVSRNQTGPKWEQDEPYPECFDTDYTESESDI